MVPADRHVSPEGDRPWPDADDGTREPERKTTWSALTDPIVVMGLALLLLTAGGLVFRAATADSDSTGDREGSPRGEGSTSTLEPAPGESATGPTANEGPLDYGEPGPLFDEVEEDGVARRILVGGFTVTDVVVDPPCPEGFSPPGLGHYLRIDLYIEIADDLAAGFERPTGEPYAFRIPHGPLTQGWPLLFTVTDTNGDDVPAVGVGCQSSGGESIFPGQAWRGSVFLDLPVTSGTLTFPIYHGGDDSPSSVSWTF